MKLFAISGCLITFFALSIHGINNETFSRSEEAEKRKTLVAGFTQFEMPLIKISTVSGDSINSKETYTEATISVINSQGSYEMTDASVSVRLRGNATLMADKKSYKLKFPEKQNILNVGVGSGKTWCLISNCYDGSLLRNLAILRTADSLDGLLYTPNCLSVELFVDDEYQGVHLLCEDINVNKSRVAIEEKPDEIENAGYLIEMSRYDEDDSFAMDKETFGVKSDLSQTESVKKSQIEYISQYMTTCINLLKKGDQTEVEQYVDLKSLLDIYLINEIVKNVDAGWSSFFMFKNTGGKLSFGPPWDFDLAMGNANSVKGFDSWAGICPFHVLNVNSCSNPWFCYALAHKWFRDLVKQRWTAIQGKISKLPEIVTIEAESHIKSYSRNFEKWKDILGKQSYIEPKQISALITYKEHYTYLSDWLDKRIKWLSTYYSSEDFLNGKFVDDSSRELTLAMNLFELSSILALENSPEVKMTYEMLPTQGITISIENGGKESWDLQVAAIGLMFERGEEYELSFDYTCTPDRSLALTVQQNHEPFGSIYFSRVNGKSEIQHFEKTFTVTKTDNNCALVFSLGGTTFNGTVITINNLSLNFKKSAKINTRFAEKCKNPLKSFSYSTKRGIVSFNLPSAAQSDLKLYSVNGRQVYTVSEKNSYGEHTYNLKSIGLVPGAYIGQMSTGSHTMQWKVIIEK